MSLVMYINTLTREDVALTGGKAASLGELNDAGVPVPKGFVITIEAFQQFMTHTGLDKIVAKFLAAIDPDDQQRINYVSSRLRQVIKATPLPYQLRYAIDASYSLLWEESDQAVAVRSSAVDEDSADASFAGQHDTFLGVREIERIVDKVRACFASLYEPRAMSYRLKKGLKLEDIKIAVVIQEMVDPEASGVMFTRDPNTHEHKTIIESVFGLGEGLVSGEIIPSHYEATWYEEAGGGWYIDRKEIPQELYYRSTYLDGPRRTSLSWSARLAQKLNANDITYLATQGQELEQRYNTPLDIEFVKTYDGDILFLQARPITTGEEQQKAQVLQQDIAAQGYAASYGIAVGKVRHIAKTHNLSNLQTGDILVTEMTTPDHVPAFDKIAGLVTHIGGVTCHAAIVSREYGTSLHRG